LPNTSFSQNVGIVGMTGVMSRHVVTIAGIILVLAGLLPKIGAIIASMPMPVLGGGVIVMFGMVAAAGMNVLSEVKMTRRNMIIIAISLTAGLGLNLVPSAVQYLPGVWKTLATSAVAPTAFLAIVLNLLIPEED
jgi:xanthine/uracil permease